MATIGSQSLYSIRLPTRATLVARPTHWEERDFFHPGLSDGIKMTRTSACSLVSQESSDIMSGVDAFRAIR